MSDDLGFPHDHSAIAWNHFLAQHIGKPNTEGFVTSFYPPINILDKALSDLYTKRWLDTAEGEQLDGIGTIVGLGRIFPDYQAIPYFGFITQISGRAFGVARLRHTGELFITSATLNDEEYRTFIKLKIALNNGHGTAEELMVAFNTELGVAKTRIDDLGNANARVYIDDFTLASNNKSSLLDTMIPKAAGVKLWLVFYHADAIFGFENQNMGYFGFGIGVLTQLFQSIIRKQQRPEPSQLPSLTLDFLTPGALDPRIVFTRGSVATYYDANNIVKTVTGNTPRWGYDPITRRFRGLLIEEQRTNIIPNSTWASADVVITANAGLAPDGTNEAYRIAEMNTSNFHYTAHNLGVTASKSHVFSVYAKAGEVRYLQLTFDGTGGSAHATFDLQAGTITEGNIQAATIRLINNGFYRCSIMGTFGAGNDVRIMLMLSNVANPGIFPNYQGDSTKGLLCWGAQFEEGAFLTSYIPTTTAAVTRNNEVCYMPTEGWFNNVYSLQIEYVPARRDSVHCGISDYNFAENTTFFQNEGFNKIGAGGGFAYGASPIILNAVNKQCGTFDAAINGAWKCANNGGGVGYASGNSTPQALATQMSIGSSPWGFDNTLNSFMRKINFWPRVLSDVEMQNVTMEDLSASLDLDFMSPGQLDSRISFTRSNIATYTDANGIIKLAAVNEPRWDYDPITHELKGLLLEEQRTNMNGFSTLHLAAWGPTGAIVSGNGSGTYPDGTPATAGLMTATDTTNSVRNYALGGIGIPATAVDYIVTVYLKKGPINAYIYINTFIENGAVYADLTNGTSLVGAELGAPLANKSTSITDAGNGWYRVSFKFTSSTGSGGIFISIGPCVTVSATGDNRAYPGVIGQGAYMWGCQVEQASFATSYIPTNGATVTRAIDRCSIPTAGWFEPPGGSWFAEYICMNNATNASRRIIAQPTDYSTSPLLCGPTQLFQYDYTALFSTVNGAALGTIAKGISSFDAAAGIGKLCLNSGAIASSGMPTGYAVLLTSGIGFLTVSSPGSTDNMTGYIRHVQYWPRILSDTEMQNATSLTRMNLPRPNIDEGAK